MTDVPDLRVWVTVWAIAAGIVLYQRWIRGHGAGLLLGYVISFGAIHWLASLLYLMPSHQGRNAVTTAYGMRMSALAMTALAVGIELTAYLRQRRAVAAPAIEDVQEAPVISPKAVRFFLITGLVLHVILFPLARGIPSVEALVSTGSTLLVMAIGLCCWNAWQTYRSRTLWMWVIGSAIFPLFTVVTQGFLGYGMAAMLTILVFVTAFYQPRWHIIVLSLMLGYLGLSVYVTYMRDRADIRSVVWGGSALDERLGQIAETLQGWEWFDVRDPLHRLRIDERLNQNALVGASVLFMQGGQEPFAHGTTLVDAAWSIVPRALWPDKPTSAGSGHLVSTYTGLGFAPGTSVGIGQVLELYVNFGTASVLVGFFVLGCVLLIVDESAFAALVARDVRRFSLFYLPGLALLNVGGSFVESASTAAAGLAVAFAVTRFTGRSDPRTAGDDLDDEAGEYGARLGYQEPDV